MFRLKTWVAVAWIVLFAAAPAGATIVDVSMVGITFVPDTVVVQVGDTIRWTNNSFLSHTTTSGSPCLSDGLWASALMGPGAVFTADGFNTAGTIPYFCIPHCAFGMWGWVVVEPATPTGIGESPVPSYRLHQNYPNPFNPTTRIEYTIAHGARVEIDVFDVQGHRVKRIEGAARTAGTHFAVWDATNSNGASVSSGIYFYQLRLDGVAVEMKKMALLK